MAYLPPTSAQTEDMPSCRQMSLARATWKELSQEKREEKIFCISCAQATTDDNLDGQGFTKCLPCCLAPFPVLLPSDGEPFMDGGIDQPPDGVALGTGIRAFDPAERFEFFAEAPEIVGEDVPE